MLVGPQNDARSHIPDHKRANKMVGEVEASRQRKQTTIRLTRVITKPYTESSACNTIRWSGCRLCFVGPFKLNQGSDQNRNMLNSIDQLTTFYKYHDSKPRTFEQEWLSKIIWSSH